MSAVTILELSINRLNSTAADHVTMTAGPEPDRGVDMFCMKGGVGVHVNSTFTVIRTSLAIFGVAANMVTAVVLTNRRLWSPTSMLLLSLVVYDAVFLLASIPASVTGLFVTESLHGYSTIMGFTYPVRYMAQMGSIYTTVTVTVERFLIVLVPLKARVFCTFGNTRKILFAVLVFCILFNIPRCFFNQLWTPVEMAYNSTRNCSNNFTTGLRFPLSLPGNASFDSTVARNWTADHDSYYYWLYFRVYELYVSGVLFYLLPYALIPILNIQLLLAIKKRRVETRMLSVRSDHQMNYTRATDLEDGVTLIVLGITACFFVCCLIPAIYNMSQIIDLPEDHPLIYFLNVASDTMLCINASTDFFFYCLWGRKFRNIFLRLFCPKKYFRRTRTMTSLNHSYFRNNRTTSETCYHSV